MGPEVTVYEIDADDRIRRVDDAWLDFARRNDGPALAREKVLGRALWSFVEGRELRLLYRSLIDGVRRTRVGVSVPFRCDAPKEARSMRLQIDPIGAGNAVRFEATTSRRVAREPIALLTPPRLGPPRGPERLSMCSLCKALRADDGAWIALERAAAAPGLIDADRLPVVSHGICPDCVELLEAPLAEPGADPDAPPGAGPERQQTAEGPSGS